MGLVEKQKEITLQGTLEQKQKNKMENETTKIRKILLGKIKMLTSKTHWKIPDKR